MLEGTKVSLSWLRSNARRNQQSWKQLWEESSLGSLFCGSFRPTRYSYEHFVGTSSIGSRTDDFSGMIGILFDGKDLLKQNERDNINIDRVKTALGWLKCNNSIYKEFLPHWNSVLPLQTSRNRIAANNTDWQHWCAQYQWNKVDKLQEKDG